MNQPAIVYQTCPKCQSSVTLSPLAGMGMCMTCQTQIKYDAAQATSEPPVSVNPVANTQPPEVPQAPTFSSNPTGAIMAYAERFGKVGMIAGVVLLLAAGLGFKYVKTHFLGSGPSTAGYGGLGLDAERPEADKMIKSVESIATRWSKDAVFLSANFQAVFPDGTVDVSKSATITYASVNKVQSALKKTRGDSLKKFTFSAREVSYGRKWGASEPWKGFVAPPVPSCTVAQLALKLGEAGLTAEQSVRVTYDPKFGYDWHVSSDAHKELDGVYSASDCNKIEK